jgi:hypothetical protein
VFRSPKRMEERSKGIGWVEKVMSTEQPEVEHAASCLSCVPCCPVSVAVTPPAQGIPPPPGGLVVQTSLTEVLKS